jgi:F420-dependent oxidoreductase-like protein
VRVSLSLTNYSWLEPPGDALAGIAHAADASNIDTLWVADHLIQADPTAPPGDDEILEAFTTLGFIAAETTRIRLGAMVSGVIFRPPAVLIKAVTTLDVLSGGRTWFGIGAGHHDGEAKALGLPFPPVAQRLDQVEETLQLASRMWRGDRRPFAGKQFRLDDPQASPAPVRPGGPPILIGGAGERRTLRLVARYADACNVFDIPDGGRTVRHKLDVLAQHCTELGRPYAELEKTMSTRLEPQETADEFVRRGAAAGELGIDHLVVVMSGPWTLDAVHTLADAAVALGEIDAAV